MVKLKRWGYLLGERAHRTKKRFPNLPYTPRQKSRLRWFRMVTPGQVGLLLRIRASAISTIDVAAGRARTRRTTPPVTSNSRITRRGIPSHRGAHAVHDRLAGHFSSMRLSFAKRRPVYIDGWPKRSPETRYHRPPY